MFKIEFLIWNKSKKCKQFNKLPFVATQSLLPLQTSQRSIQAVIYMPFYKIDTGVKHWALQLIAEGWPLVHIINVIGVSCHGISQWSDNYNTFGSVKPPAIITGWPRVLHPTAVEGLYDLLAESPELYIDKIAEYLVLYHNLPISIMALHNNLTELGLTWKIMQRAALERDDTLWAAWLEDTLLQYTANEMVFLDKSSKDGHTIFCKYRWSL